MPTTKQKLLQYATLCLTSLCLLTLGACTPVGDDGGDGGGGGGICGDDRCRGNEDAENCPQDCSGENSGDCGNGTCDDGESCATCAVDCACGDGERCDAGASACVPLCGDRVCGDDGFGGSCGACEGDEVCNAEGGCQEVPETCGNEACDEGEDCSLCPQDCGECCGDGVCVAEVGENCVTCEADCGCEEGSSCDDTSRVCLTEGCTADCDGKACGDDGCGGSCGECATGEMCTEEQICQPEVSPDGPVVEMFTANADRMTEGDAIRLMVTVSDPDGVEDITGGNLVDPGTGATYKPFNADAQEGTWSVLLNWGELHATTAIDFGEGETTRRLQAIFTDEAGNQNSALLTLALFCEADTAACGDGSCTAIIDNNDDCGACGNVCGEGSSCNDRSCTCDTGFDLCAEECVDLFFDPNNCGECGSACDMDCEQGLCTCRDTSDCPDTTSCYNGEVCIDILEATMLTATEILPEVFAGYASATSIDLREHIGETWIIICNPTAAQAELACQNTFQSPGIVAPNPQGFVPSGGLAIRDLDCPPGPLENLEDCTFDGPILEDCGGVEGNSDVVIICGGVPPETEDGFDRGCNNFADDDGDGLVDCDDPDCAGIGNCEGPVLPETEDGVDQGCGNFQDDDGDGLVDCDDPDCASADGCDEPDPPGEDCYPVEDGVNEGNNARTLNMGPTNGPRANSYFHAHTFTPSTNGTYTITLTSEDFDAYLFVITNDDTCTIEGENDDTNGRNSEVSLSLTSGVEYLIIATTFDPAVIGDYNIGIR